MPEPRHSPATWRFFELGFTRWRARRMLPTRFGGAWPRLSPDRPAVLVANHTSWWDGFLLREVQRRLRPDAPFYTVVLAEHLDRHPGLRRLGGVPVTPSDPSSVRRMLRTLRHLRERDVHAIFSYFPQGRIWPVTRRPLGVRRGIEAVARALAPVDLIPVSIHLEPLADLRPTPFLWIGPPISVDPSGDATTTDHIEACLALGLDRIRERLDHFGEDVSSAWVDADGYSAPDLEPQRRHGVGRRSDRSTGYVS